jgi:hypothetical protein
MGLVKKKIIHFIGNVFFRFFILYFMEKIWPCGGYCGETEIFVSNQVVLINNLPRVKL